MRICIDVRYTLPSGASTYMSNLVGALARARSEHDFVLLELEGSPLPVASDAERILCPRLKGFSQYRWAQRRLPELLRKSGIGVYHSLKHVGPFNAPCRQVYSMSSLGGYVGYFSKIYPMPLSEHIYWRYLGRRWLTKLDWLITCASFIGEHIARRFRFPTERISCIPFGRDPDFAPSTDRGDHPPNGSPYILQVANVLPVKNTLTLVRAFSLLAGRHEEMKLVICGDQSHSYFRKVLGATETLGIRNRVEFLQGISKDELCRTYQRGRVFTLPSLHEGCPLALLEAMSCGLPCVTSDRAGLPELGGDAVLRYEKVTDAAELASALDRVLRDETLRDELARRAVQRAATYSWDRAARETIEVYDQLKGTS